MSIVVFSYFFLKDCAAPVNGAWFRMPPHSLKNLKRQGLMVLFGAAWGNRTSIPGPAFLFLGGNPLEVSSGGDVGAAARTWLIPWSVGLDGRRCSLCLIWSGLLSGRGERAVYIYMFRQTLIHINKNKLKQNKNTDDWGDVSGGNGFATEPENLSSISSIHIVEGESCSFELSFDLHICATAHMSPRKIKNKNPTNVIKNKQTSNTEKLGGGGAHL